MSGQEYTVSLKVPELVGELLVGDGNGLDAIAGANGAHCRLEIIRHVNSISPYSEIKLTASPWGLSAAFDFLLNRIRIAQKIIDEKTCNERRINDLQLELSEIRARHAKEVVFLKQDRMRLANQCGEVVIPRLANSESESDNSTSDSSDSESIGFGEFSFKNHQKRQKRLQKTIRRNKCALSSKMMKTYLSKFMAGVTYSPNEAAITFVAFMHHFVTFIQTQNAQFGSLKANQGFKDSLLIHLQMKWPEVLLKTGGVQKVAVVVDFPQ